MALELAEVAASMPPAMMAGAMPEQKKGKTGLIIGAVLAVLVVASVITASLWLLTFLVQVPCHDRLRQGFDEDVLHRLVASHWIRTGAWSLRGVLACGLLVASGEGVA